MVKLASHNSWSYVSPKKLWMKLIRFTAKCQNVDIKTQYDRYGVRYFDLRLNASNQIVHGHIVYFELNEILSDLEFLDKKGDCYIRVSFDIRNKKYYTDSNIEQFRNLCAILENSYCNIKFVGGENLYNHELNYKFKYNSPTCIELYSSVRKPKIIDDWFPRIYAKLNNRKNLEKDYNTEFLMIDFVDDNKRID